MKLVSFRVAGRSSYGVLRKDGIVDAGFRLGSSYPSLKSVLDSPERLKDLENREPDYPYDEVELQPPIPEPGRILCIGLNYRSHIAETGREVPRYPLLFPRYPDSIVGDRAPLLRPKLSEQYDYEGELAFVIGRGGRYIERSAAMSHVAGYACFNDGSVRDYQRHTTQFLPGKNFWRSGSFGPWLVTPEETGPVGELKLTTRLNGKEVQRAQLDDLLFGVEALIEYISAIMPLMPGDVIATGTTGGVGNFRKPPLWLKPGDLIEVSIDRLGHLQNRVMAEEET
jgi:2-keto-4-pentenoate hydratase/2-oxohepta-3-ene-1,7-dioic acid hydratase in catechol pathway